MAKPHKIGTINVENTLWINDAVEHTKDSDSNNSISLHVRSGKYQCAVCHIYDVLPPYNTRVKTVSLLRILAEDVDPKTVPQSSWKACCKVHISNGLVGVYTDDGKCRTDEELTHITRSNVMEKAWCKTGTTISKVAYGDDNYDILVHRNSDNEIDGIEIKFIP